MCVYLSILLCSLLHVTNPNNGLTAQALYVAENQFSADELLEIFVFGWQCKSQMQEDCLQAKESDKYLVVSNFLYCPPSQQSSRQPCMDLLQCWLLFIFWPMVTYVPGPTSLHWHLAVLLCTTTWPRAVHNAACVCSLLCVCYMWPKQCIAKGNLWQDDLHHM